MSINLQNPKRFLPLLLFAGMLFVLIGTGFSYVSANSEIVNLGILCMFAAVIFFALMNRRRMGF